MSVYRLDRLLSPHSLAVIGASPRETSVGRHVVANIRAAGFPGAVHVVNPNFAAIEGIATVKSLDAISGSIDVAVIAVPPAAVPETVAAAGAKGAAAAIIITAGLGHGAGSLAEAAEHARIALACWCRPRSSMRASRRACRRRETSRSSRNPAPSSPA
jgi:acetyltransferase